MGKFNIVYTDYKKVIENDIRALTELLMNAKAYDKMVKRYLDQSEVPSEFVIDYVTDDKQAALEDGNVVGYLELNAFAGALKKIRTAKKIKKRRG
jgi:N-acetylglutamate synthase-like GNAT family acetyltransferase